MYYRENSFKALKHYIGSLSSVFFQYQIILKFLELKTKSVFVKDFLFSTKVKLKKIKHLNPKGTFSWDPFPSFFRDLFASVALVHKNWCKRSQLVRLLMSRKTRLNNKIDIIIRSDSTKNLLCIRNGICVFS